MGRLPGRLAARRDHRPPRAPEAPPRPPARAGARRALGPGALGRLVPLLEDPALPVRRAGLRAAARALAPGVPWPGPLAPLLERLGDEEPDVRACCARVLSRLGPSAREALPALRAAFAEPERDVVFALADAWRDVDDAVDPRLALLRDALADPDPLVRRAATQGLVRLLAAGDARFAVAEPDLVRALDDPHPDVRAYAAIALRWLRGDPPRPPR